MEDLNQIKARIEQLRKQLNEHNYRYYVLDSPIISDAEYDLWMSYLKQLEAHYPQFITPDSPTQRIGAESAKFVKHSGNVRSREAGEKQSTPFVEAYLDIETTGLSRSYHEITVVGIGVCIKDNTNFFQFVGNDITAVNILDALNGVSEIYTYNGKSFDLPFIHSRLGVNLAERFAHHDLMHDCHSYDLYGGCKEAEKRLGIERRLTEVDGSVAVELWHKYIEQHDENALSTLLEYNKEDVLTLKLLREKLEQYTATSGEPDAHEERETHITHNDKRPSETVNPEQGINGPLVGQHFVITGQLETFPREDAEAKIRELGGLTGDYVSRKTTYLVVGTEPGSKLARAQALGVKTITEGELLGMLGQKNS